MKSVVLGKVIENVYSVDTKTKTIKDEHGKEKIVYIAKPVLNKESKTKEWREILHFEGEPRYNNKYSYFYLKAYIASCGEDYKYLNVSENDEVAITEEIFRADLNELHLHSNKVLEEIDANKKEAEKEYNEHIHSFNEMMIKSNKAMQDYCDLHHLAYWDSDCEKVFSLVYPDKEYEIKNGKMDCKTTYTVLNSGCYAIGSDCDAEITVKNNGYINVLSESITACVSDINCVVRG